MQRRLFLVVGLLTAFLFAGGAEAQKMKPMQPCAAKKMPMKGKMVGMTPAQAPVVPAVTGYSEGETILFLHTETSDPKIAKILTDMMGSPVLVVPSLAKAPRGMIAHVYVFTNGAKPDGPMGPLGFQPDVFENPPGKPGYTPLRMLALVTWKDESKARTLKSAAEVEKALKNREVTIKEPGVVVNMPFVTWPGGKR